jgi:hypothetical protein
LGTPPLIFVQTQGLIEIRKHRSLVVRIFVIAVTKEDNARMDVKVENGAPIFLGNFGINHLSGEFFAGHTSITSQKTVNQALEHAPDEMFWYRSNIISISLRSLELQNLLLCFLVILNQVM